MILLDWNMPVMDGLEFLRELAGPAGPAAARGLLHTMNELKAIEQALEAGADEYVMKPFDESIIRDKLEQVGVL